MFDPGNAKKFEAELVAWDARHRDLRTEREHELRRIVWVIDEQARFKGAGDPFVMLAIAFHESRINPHTKDGRRGELGMFQVTRGIIHPMLARASDEELRDLEVNTSIAARRLADCYRLAGGNLHDTLRRWNGGGPKARAYARKVIATLKRIQQFKEVRT